VSQSQWAAVSAVVLNELGAPPRLGGLRRHFRDRVTVLLYLDSLGLFYA
jgi:hypothetical protein